MGDVDRRGRPRRWIAVLLLLGGGFGLFSCDDGGERTGAAGPRPHVILFSIDTLRARNLGCYGYARATSPVLDRWAKDAIVFERAITQSPKTGPSHMTMFTGLFPSAHRVTNWGTEDGTTLSPEITTLAEILGQAGYATYASTAGGNVKPELGFGRGFDEYEVRTTGASANMKQAIEMVERHLDASAPKGDGTPQQPPPPSEAPPFFLFVHTYQVHDPYLPPKKYRQMFDSDPDYSGDVIASRHQLEKEMKREKGRSEHEVYWDRVDTEDTRDVRRLIDLYDANIRAVDDAFARLIAMLTERGILERCLIIVTSDHGEEFGEHGGFQHNGLSSEIAHVPLIVRLPGATSAGHRVGGLARLVDLTPTLLDLLDIPSRLPFQGATLWSEGRPDPGSRHAISEWTTRDDGKPFEFSIRTLDWTYLCFGQKPYGLYRADDHLERSNLVADPALAGTTAALDRTLRAWHTDCDRLGDAFRKGATVELAAELREQLEALGYVR